MSIGVPSAIKTFNWLGTLWGGKIQFTTPMLFALGFVSLFVSGGLSGLFLAQPAVDNLLHATYYVVAHFHLVMGVAAIFGIFAATYFWFPKMFGRMMNEPLGKLHFWFTFVGAYCIFMPMHFVGIAGGIRRYADASGRRITCSALQPVHQFMSIAAFITGAAQILFLFNFFWSLKSGPKASKNPGTPRRSNGSPIRRRRTIISAGHFPSVYRGPYEFSVPGAKEDFVPQNLTPQEVAREKE